MEPDIVVKKRITIDLETCYHVNDPQEGLDGGWGGCITVTINGVELEHGVDVAGDDLAENLEDHLVHLVRELNVEAVGEDHLP